LDVATQMLEAEHIGLNDPRAGRHAVEAERAVIVGERYQASFALGGANGCPRDQLAAGLDGARLGKSSAFKNKWQAHCQKHENFEH